MLRNNPKFVHEIYNDYLDKENELNKIKYKKHEGWFSASSSGSCIKQLYYKINNYEEQPMERRVKRLLRLGTLVHNDLEKAMDSFIADPDSNYANGNYTIYKEKQVSIPHLKVVGHLDLAIHQENTLNVIDYKTIGDYPWKMRFGRKKEQNPSQHYYLQVATYGIALANEIENPQVELNLIWYNKNDSRFKTQYIEPKYLDYALEYWENVNEVVAGYGEDIVEIEPGTMTDIPAENWQCNYCAFKRQCEEDWTNARIK